MNAPKKIPHAHSYKKEPRAKLIECPRSEPNCPSRDIEVAFSGTRTQRLSLKQAESFAKNLMDLVNLAKVSQVMES